MQIPFLFACLLLLLSLNSFAQEFSMNTPAKVLAIDAAPQAVRLAWAKKFPALKLDTLPQKGFFNSGEYGGYSLSYRWEKRDLDGYYQATYAYQTPDYSQMFEFAAVLNEKAQFVAYNLMLKGDSVARQFVNKELYKKIKTDFLKRVKSTDYTLYYHNFPEGARYVVADYSGGFGIFYRYTEKGEYAGKD